MSITVGKSHTFNPPILDGLFNGISLPSLQKLLGHDRLTTTEIYLNLSPEERYGILKQVVTVSEMKDQFRDLKKIT